MKFIDEDAPSKDEEVFCPRCSDVLMVYVDGYFCCDICGAFVNSADCDKDCN